MSGEGNRLSSGLFRAAAVGTLLANYGRINLEKEILSNIVMPPPEKADNWLGYKADIRTAMAVYKQCYFYYIGMGLFYLHLSYKKGHLSALELVGLLNQLAFHLHSISEFRGLSQKVSALFALLLGGGAAGRFLGY